MSFPVLFCEKDKACVHSLAVIQTQQEKQTTEIVGNPGAQEGISNLLRVT